ncbi:mechanosensitive ion channel [Nibribacter ruber]|uniref:Mechanosensitive ion channel n=1 Tax=Nibribacter ruber TaxID=2698458 RepID=A0A6P1P0R9_9BACT|nr:mechanosensitive ion channel domain-containing protein [Nibribacter ruber]QHL87003.1 mechanosensitive ion channel [Nibribacter ruber]
MFDLDRLVLSIQDFAVLYGIKLLIAIFILIVGLWIIGRVTNFAYRVMKQRNVDPSLRPFLRNVLRIALLVLLFMVVVAQVGLEITSFVAVLGSAGLAVGLALQGSLSNFAGGVLLLTVKPFKVGDFIEAQGQKGRVCIINIFNTVIITEDNKTVFLPNGPLASAVIVNYDVEKNRRLEIQLVVDASVPLSKVKAVLHQVIDAEPLVLQEPAPTIGVEKLSAQTVTLFVHAWVLGERGRSRSNVFDSLTEQIKDAFEKEEIPLK